VSDYHLHLHPHKPQPGSPPPGVYPPGWIDGYVEAAMARGVTELGFTEHFYRCVESVPILGRWWETDPSLILRAEIAAVQEAEVNLSLDRYVEVVLDARARGLPVKLGLEVDFQPGTEQKVLDLLAGYPFDYLLGSVHWIGAWDFTRAGAPAEFERRGVERAWRDYFALETQLAGSGMVDVLAHPDQIKYWGIRPPAEVMEELYPSVVDTAVRSGVAFEVSSAGLRRRAAEIYPAPAFLARFAAAGVPITLASDAHVPDLAGAGHREVVAAARAAGYTSYLRFERRRRVTTPLPGLAD
jgi:histidinol-phosphatase (PHP family)